MQWPTNHVTQLVGLFLHVVLRSYPDLKHACASAAVKIMTLGQIHFLRDTFNGAYTHSAHFLREGRDLAHTGIDRHFKPDPHVSDAKRVYLLFNPSSGKIIKLDFKHDMEVDIAR